MRKVPESGRQKASSRNFPKATSTDDVLFIGADPRPPILPPPSGVTLRWKELITAPLLHLNFLVRISGGQWSHCTLTVQRKIMAQKKRLPDVGAAKQRPLEHAKKKADQSGPAGKQPQRLPSGRT